METFIFIPNYKDRYKINKNGEIYSLLSKKILKPSKKNNVVLRNNHGKIKHYNCARLVYKIFVNNIPKNHVIKHKNCNKLDNNINNLICVSRNKVNSKFTKIKLDNKKIWKPIKNYEKFYKISEYGDIYSLKSSKILKNKKGLNGYINVKLIDIYGKRKSVLIHRILYSSFKNKNIDKNMVIDHIDRNKVNNHISNLREISYSNNCKNVIRKKNEPNNKISQYDNTHNLIKKWNSYKEIFDELNIGYNKIKKVLNKPIMYNNCYWKFVVINKDTFKKIGIINCYDFSNYFINKEGIIINNKGKQIKYSISGGYNRVTLTSNKHRKTFFVHRLVAHKFLKFNLNSNLYINHKDENKINNSTNNLEILTHKDNITYSYGKKIKQINIKTNKVINIFNSINDAFRFLNKNYGANIRLVCNGKRKTAFGYKWCWC